MMQPPEIRGITVEDLPMARRWFRPGATAALIAALVAIGVSPAGSAPVLVTEAEAIPQRPARANLDEFEKIDIENIDEKYKKWLEEVDVIITEDEREVFVRLESDFQRDAFMEKFWRVRDPSPGTPNNEYQEEHYRRLEHVEFHFSRDTPRPGWMTDRGRMYILLGEPMNTKRLPNTQLAYPVEFWFFHANPKLGIPPFFYLAFFKRNGVGEYRLYSPIVDGPMKLLNPAGENYARGLQTGGFDDRGGRMASSPGEIGAAYDTLQEVDAELAQVALSLIPGDYAATEGFPSMRSQMMIGDIEMIPERIMPTAQWAYPILTGMVEADVRFESLPIQAVALALLDPSGIPFIHYGVSTEGGRLNLNNYEDSWYITFEVAGALTDAQNRVVTGISGVGGQGSKVLQADLDAEEARMLRSGPFYYFDRFPVVDGRYEFDLVIENNVSREYGHEAFDIEVPVARPDVIRSSSPILLLDYFEDENFDPFGSHRPFQVAGHTLLPSFDHEFTVGGKLHAYMQIYLPAQHPNQLDVTTQLSDDRGVVIDRIDYVRAVDADRNGTINHISTLDLSDVAAGDYRVRVDVVGDDRPGTTMSVRVVEPDAERPRPFVHMTQGAPPTDPYFAYDRAQQLQTLGDVDKAIEVLETALSRVDTQEVVDLQMALLAEAGRWDEVLELLRPKAVERPNDEEMLLAMAEAYAHMGQNYDAIRLYERARLVSDEETAAVLNPLASAYFADGQVDKARAILELSLELDPEQPEIRRMLSEVLRKDPGPPR